MFRIVIGLEWSGKGPQGVYIYIYICIYIDALSPCLDIHIPEEIQRSFRAQSP